MSSTLSGNSLATTDLSISGTITTANLTATGTTNLAGATTSADINFGDNDKAIFGAGSDLKIYHTGSHSYIDESGTGNLYLSSNGGGTIITGGGGAQAQFFTGGAVNLFHNSSQKLATTSTGIDVTGTATMDGLTVDGDARVNGTAGKLTWVNDVAGWTQAMEAGDASLYVKSGVGSPVKRIGLSNIGDISFYEDTGTTAKFFWDASAEGLSLGGTALGKFNVSDGTNPLVMDCNATYNELQSYNRPLHVNRQGNNTILNATSGNVGIGTSSPSHALDVIGGENTTQAVFAGPTGGTGRGLRIATGSTGFQTNDIAILDAQNPTSGTLAFQTSGSERMRIDSSGNVYFKGNGVQVVPPVNETVMCGDSGLGQTLRFNTSYNATRGVIQFFYNSAGIGGITTTSTSTAYNTSSDYRLKEDWQPMEGSVERVKALKPVNFAWKADGSRVDGFLAHELQEVVPEAATGTKDAMRTEEYEVTPAVLDDEGNVVTEAVMGTREVPDYQGIDQSKLVPLLTAALQEALTRIETLEAKVAVLETN